MSNGKGYLSILSLQLQVLTQHFIASVMKDEQGRPFIVVREYVVPRELAGIQEK